MEFPPHAAWLDFRSPEDDEAGCWQRRWVVLYQGMLTLFQDESCTRSMAHLALPSAARALAFQDPRAPTRTALRLARPHGFLVDLNPLDAEDSSLPSGEFRQLLMFEAADAEDLKVWLDVLRPRMDASRVPAPVLPKERGRSPLSARASEFDIDDFSDYEDDTHARASSLHALDSEDWTSPTSRRVPSRPRHSKSSPSTKGETSGDEVKTSCSGAELALEDEEVY